MAMTAVAGWAIARAWAERVPFDFALAAELASVDPHYVRDLARKQGWSVRSGADRVGVREVAVMRQRLWERVEAATARPAGESFDKAEIDAIQVLMRALDRLEQSLPPGDDGGQDNEDAMASALKRIDERIVALARNLAASTAV